jgi:hypothetical protein
MEVGVIRIGLTLIAEDEDEARLREDQPYLLDELAEINGVSVEWSATGPALPGTRSGGLDTVALIVALGGSGATLPVIVGLARDWLQRRGSGSVRLKIGTDEIEITHASVSAQDRALDEFLRRHPE